MSLGAFGGADGGGGRKGEGVRSHIGAVRSAYSIFEVPLLALTMLRILVGFGVDCNRGHSESSRGLHDPACYLASVRDQQLLHRPDLIHLRSLSQRPRPTPRLDPSTQVRLASALAIPPPPRSPSWALAWPIF